MKKFKRNLIALSVIIPTVAVATACTPPRIPEVNLANIEFSNVENNTFTFEAEDITNVTDAEYSSVFESEILQNEVLNVITNTSPYVRADYINYSISEKTSTDYSSPVAVQITISAKAWALDITNQNTFTIYVQATLKKKVITAKTFMDFTHTPYDLLGNPDTNYANTPDQFIFDTILNSSLKQDLTNYLNMVVFANENILTVNDFDLIDFLTPDNTRNFTTKQKISVCFVARANSEHIKTLSSFYISNKIEFVGVDLTYNLDDFATFKTAKSIQVIPGDSGELQIDKTTFDNWFGDSTSPTDQYINLLKLAKTTLSQEIAGSSPDQIALDLKCADGTFGDGSALLDDGAEVEIVVTPHDDHPIDGMITLNGEWKFFLTLNAEFNIVDIGSVKNWNNFEPPFYDEGNEIVVQIPYVNDDYLKAVTLSDVKEYINGYLDEVEVVVADWMNDVSTLFDDGTADGVHVAHTVGQDDFDISIPSNLNPATFDFTSDAADVYFEIDSINKIKSKITGNLSSKGGVGHNDTKIRVKLLMDPQSDTYVDVYTAFGTGNIPTSKPPKFSIDFSIEQPSVNYFGPDESLLKIDNGHISLDIPAYRFTLSYDPRAIEQDNLSHYGLVAGNTYNFDSATESIKDFCRGTQGNKYVVTNTLSADDYYPSGSSVLPQYSRIYYEKNGTVYSGKGGASFAGIEMSSNHIPFVQNNDGDDYDVFVGQWNKPDDYTTYKSDVDGSLNPMLVNGLAEANGLTDLISESFGNIYDTNTIYRKMMMGFKFSNNFMGTDWEVEPSGNLWNDANYGADSNNFFYFIEAQLAITGIWRNTTWTFIDSVHATTRKPAGIYIDTSQGDFTKPQMNLSMLISSMYTDTYSHTYNLMELWADNDNDWYNVALADEKTKPLGAVFSAIHQGR